MARRNHFEEADIEPSRPRPAKGGIRSQSTEEFGASWWARRWIEVLERFDIGVRLVRGKTYARDGQVLSIKVEPGVVTARVQGSRSKPYDVSIKVKPLTEADWAKVLKTLRRQVLFAAKLLAGEMPPNIEMVFKEAGLSLFPTKLWDITTSCTCDDWSNPCQHTAATYYLLGEEFNRDPYLLFSLRGLSRETLMTALGATNPEAATRQLHPEESIEPLSADLTQFWGNDGEWIDEYAGGAEIPSAAAPRLRQLGGFPFWRGETPFLDTLVPTYNAASVRGLEVLLEKPSLSEAEQTEVGAETKAPERGTEPA